MPPGGSDSSSQVRITLLADTAVSKKPSTFSRQMSTTTSQNQEFANLYQVDDAKSANILKKWQQNEANAATVGQSSNVDLSNPYSDVAAAAATGVSASATKTNEIVWSTSSARNMAQDMLAKLATIRLHLLPDTRNTPNILILASSATIIVMFLIFSILIHKLKAKRRAKDAKVHIGPAGPDTCTCIVKRRNSNEICRSDSRRISRSLALQPLDTSTANTTGLARKSSRRRSSSESSPPNAAFAGCHQRDMAFAKDRRADTLVNAMPPDMGGKYKQHIIFARRHSLTQSTCWALDAALSVESGRNVDEEEISISSSAFDLDV